MRVVSDIRVVLPSRDSVGEVESTRPASASGFRKPYQPGLGGGGTGGTIGVLGPLQDEAGLEDLARRGVIGVRTGVRPCPSSLSSDNTPMPGSLGFGEQGFEAASGNQFACDGLYYVINPTFTMQRSTFKL